MYTEEKVQELTSELYHDLVDKYYKLKIELERASFNNRRLSEALRIYRNYGTPNEAYMAGFSRATNRAKRAVNALIAQEAPHGPQAYILFRVLDEIKNKNAIETIA